jgi:hypothetical protein
VSLRSPLPEGVPGDTCSTAGTIALDRTADTYIDLLPEHAGAGTLGSDTTPSWIHVAGDGGMYSVSLVGVTWNDPFSSGALAVCEDCTEAASCVSLSQASAVSVRIGEQGVLRLRGVLALPAPSQTWGQLIFRSAQSAASP